MVNQLSKKTGDDFSALVTVGDLLNWGVDQFERAHLFFGHGTDNAWDEALQLIMYCLRHHFDHLENDEQKLLGLVLSKQDKHNILKILEERIKKKIPSAYLIHQAYFAGYEFYVDERVLIPRSPIVELIEEGFSPWIKEKQIRHVLDLCTGSGCIAIACALRFPKVCVDALDISKDALAVAKINCEHHHVSERVSIIESDLFNKLQDQCYDLMICNPPYVGRREINQLPQEYHHEPYLGFYGGETGLDFVDVILHQAAAYLDEKGILIMEVGYNMDEVTQRYPKVPFLWLEFARGGEGVFILNRDQLKKYFSDGFSNN